MAENAVVQGGRLNVDVERALRDALRSLRFGSVTLVIQDGKVMQIEKHEKFRLNKGEHYDGSGI